MASNPTDFLAQFRTDGAAPPPAAATPKTNEAGQPLFNPETGGATGPTDHLAQFRTDPQGPEPSIRRVDNSLGDEFRAGLGSGIDGLQGSLYGVAGLMGRELGIGWMEDAGNKGAEEQFTDAANATRQSAGFSDIDSAGGFFRWSAGVLGEAIPSLVSAGSGAGFGAAVGRKAVELAVKRSLARRTERDLVGRFGFGRAEALTSAKELMNSPTGQNMLKQAFVQPRTAAVINASKAAATTTGSRAGLITAASLPQIGAIDQELVAAGVEDPGLTALLGGVVGGGLEALPMARLLGKMFPGVDKAVSKTFVKDFAVATGTQAVLEGSTEGVQEMIQLAAMAYHDPSFDMFSPDARTRVIDAFAAGALVGGITGGGAEGIGQITATGRETAKRTAAAAKVAKPKIKAFTMDTIDKAGNKIEEVLPEGFVPADKTVFEEIKSRVFDTVQPAIESATNSLRNQFQSVVDSIDENLEGGANVETAKFSQIVQAAHNKFVEEHKQQFADAKDYLNKQSRFISETAARIKDPVERARFIDEHVAAAKEKMAPMLERIRKAAAKRDQTVQAEVDNMDFDFDPDDGLDINDDNEIADDDADAAEDIARSSLPEPGEVDSPSTLTFGKNQLSPRVTVSGKEEVEGFEDRGQAQLGLATLRKQFPESKDEDFEIIEQEDGSLIIETVNPELADTHRFNQAFRASRDSAGRTKKIPENEKRKFKYKLEGEPLGFKFKSVNVDMMTLALRGKNLIKDPKNPPTLLDGLQAMIGDMLARGFIDTDSANGLLDKFNENFPTEAKTEGTEFAPAGKFPTAKSAKFNMINFTNSLKAKGITVPFDMFGEVLNEDGTWSYGIVDPKKFRALRAKKPEDAAATLEALTEQRRQDLLADKTQAEFRGNDVVGGPSTAPQTDPGGQQNLPLQRRTRRDQETSSGDLADQAGSRAGAGRIDASKTETTKTGELPESSEGPQGDFADATASFPAGDTRNQRTSRILTDTEPQADDRTTDPDTLVSEFQDREEEIARTASRQNKRTPKGATQPQTEQDNKILKIIARPAKVKVLFGLSKDEAKTTAAVKKLVRFVQKTLGLENDVIVMDDTGLRNLIKSGEVTDPSFEETLRNPNVHARNIRIGDKSYVYLSDKVLSDPNLTVLALGHELGHHLYSVAWDNLTFKGQRALKDAFDKSPAGKDLIEQFDKVAESNDPDGQAQNLQETDAAFNEWMADQLAAWITQRRTPKGAVEAFFSKVGGKIRRLYEFMKGTDNGRFTLDQTFSDFADAVAQRATQAESPGANPLSDSAMRAWFSNEGVTMYKFWGRLPQQDNMTIPAPRTQAGDKALARIEKNYPQIAKRALVLRNWVFNAYRVAVAPSTSAVRTIGKRIKAANDLASIFNREKQGAAKKNANYHQRVELMRGQFSDAYAKLSHLSVERKAAVAKSLRSKEGKADQTFDADEQAMRNLFDAMHAYAIESGLPVRKIANYFPRQMSRELLVNNKQKILDHLTNTRNIPLEKARNIYNSLIDPNAQDGRATIDVTETPGFTAMNSRKKGIGSDKFFDQFLDNNLDGITSNYLNAVVKRSEFNRLLGEAMPVTELDARAAINAGIWDPKGKMNKILREAKKQGAEDDELRVLEQYIDANLGQLGRDSAIGQPGPRRFMAGMMAYQNLRVLLFTVFASLPDLVGPSIRSGNMRGTWKTLKNNMHDLVKNDNDLSDMARAYGIISDTVNDHIITEYVDNHHMPAKLRKWNDGFFKWTGLNWYTDFTRKAALAVGVDYIQQQAEIMANPENEKAGFKARDALAELGLKKADVDAWVSNGKPTYDSISQTGDPKVAEALIQFVDESIMRPNASARPIMASHPGAMLVYHLKNYMYAINDIILKRIKFNIDESDNPAQLTAAIAPAIGMMLLTAVGLELRELIQYAGSNRKPPTDRMDGWEYTWELFQRSGLTGIAQIGIDLEGAEDRGQSHIAGIGGPTLSQAADLLSKPATQTIPKAIPVIGQLPAARNAVRTVL